MKAQLKFSYTFILLLSALLLSACMEHQYSGPFKQPTKEDLKAAIETYVTITNQYMESQNYERAMASIKKALDIDKNSPLAVTTLAVVYEQQGDTDKARETFKKALSLDDKFSPAHLSYGNFLFQQKNYAESCKQYQFAAADDFFKNRATAYYNLGMCFSALGDTQKSEEAYSRCLGLDPNNTATLLALADINFQKQLYPEAKQLFDKHAQLMRGAGQKLTSEALWLGIRLERIFGNQNAESSWALLLKNTYPYSKEYLEYKNSLNK